MPSPTKPPEGGLPRGLPLALRPPPIRGLPLAAPLAGEIGIGEAALSLFRLSSGLASPLNDTTVPSGNRKPAEEDLAISSPPPRLAPVAGLAR
jgi:hypothetical protein